MDKVINSTASTIDNAPYIFEITNMTNKELKGFMLKLAKDAERIRRAEEKAKNPDAAEEEEEETTEEQPAEKTEPAAQ